MDTFENKVNINGKEYDVRDLSPLAQDQIVILNIADNNIRKSQAELAVMVKGRDVVVQELIDEVEKEKVEAGEAND